MQVQELSDKHFRCCKSTYHIFHYFNLKATADDKQINTCKSMAEFVESTK